MNTALAFEPAGGVAAPLSQPEQFRLVKTSKQGVRYYFMGKRDPVEAQSGDCVLVAQTRPFAGDACVFLNEAEARTAMRALNSSRISDAFWEMEPVHD
ncbi:30S ribosomal protein S17 [Roseibium sp. TrichSKD4]|uniref:hypothetical protein n=1 Tax=Roseibium sp. TrichSKD4 TaxID=744980 RepID=UPI0001E5692D|nr:hypothetical protein [Roseibium sp. TrichSKD4]EFO32461.1 30S ribosomal protein S17 [Roseibium sp. TrichSKD4]